MTNKLNLDPLSDTYMYALMHIGSIRKCIARCKEGEQPQFCWAPYREFAGTQALGAQRARALEAATSTATPATDVQPDAPDVQRMLAGADAEDQRMHYGANRAHVTAHDDGSQPFLTSLIPFV